jgi:serine O-acetyltransferase
MKHSESALDPAKHDRIRSRSDYRSFLKADLEAHGLKAWHWYLRFKHPALHFQRVLRRVEFLSIGETKLHQIAWGLERLYLARLSLLTGISIPPGVFGRGLSIAHYGSIVVNDKARVGSYCRIHSATNIGIGKNGTPRIGDFAYIGPGAVISGGIIVGAKSAIGANAVVLDDVPEESTAVGVPAIVKPNRSSYAAMPEAIQAIMNRNAR